MDGFMDDMDIPKDDVLVINRELRFLWFYWISSIGMIPILAATVLIVGERFSESVQDDEHLVNVITTVFLVVSIASVAVSVLLKKQLLSGRLQLLITLFLKRSRVAQPEWLGRFRAVNIICTAMASIAGPMGFVLFVLSGEMWLFGLFMAIGAGGVIYHRPGREELIEYYQRCHKTID